MGGHVCECRCLCALRLLDACSVLSNSILQWVTVVFRIALASECDARAHCLVGGSVYKTFYCRVNCPVAFWFKIQRRGPPSFVVWGCRAMPPFIPLTNPLSQARIKELMHYELYLRKLLLERQLRDKLQQTLSMSLMLDIVDGRLRDEFAELSLYP